jgi:hypothetical protein
MMSIVTCADIKYKLAGVHKWQGNEDKPFSPTQGQRLEHFDLQVSLPEVWQWCGPAPHLSPQDL